MTKPEVQVLDLSYLFETSAGDTAFIEEILTDYLQEVEKYLRELKQLFTSEEWDGLQRCAHTIKGASANVGAVSVRIAAADIEAAARAGTLATEHNKIERLSRDIHELKSLVERRGISSLISEHAS